MTGPTLKSPLNIQSNETPTCVISKNSAMANILQQCKLIVWDECTIAHTKIGGIRLNYERSTKQLKSILWSDDFVSRRLSSNFTNARRPTQVDELDAYLTFDRMKSVGVASIQ